MLTDPIADLLNRLKNASGAQHLSVSVRFSKMKEAMAQVLQQEGFVKNVRVQEEGKLKWLQIDLLPRRSLHVRRVSKPGRRLYIAAGEVPKVKSGLGVALVSTSKGILSDKQARKEKVGGEYLCDVY